MRSFRGLIWGSVSLPAHPFNLWILIARNRCARVNVIGEPDVS